MAWRIRQNDVGEKERSRHCAHLSRARVLYKDVAFTFSVSTNRAEYSTSQLSGLPMYKCPTAPEDINSPTHQLKKTSTQRLIHLKAHQLETSPTHPLQNLKPYLLFYNVTLILAPFQRKYWLKRWQISAIFRPSYLRACLYLSLEPAFCTILPFYFACQLIISYPQLRPFHP